MAGVGVCPARITLIASTRTGIPGRPRAGRFRESIAGQRYSAASDRKEFRLAMAFGTKPHYQIR